MRVVLACRGCCCGTSKHPNTDHDAQLVTLRDAVGDLLKITTCLGQCSWSNVVVGIDPVTGDQTWFAGVLAEADTDAIVHWLDDPDRRQPPELLVRTPTEADQRRALQRSWYRPTPAAG